MANLPSFQFYPGDWVRDPVAGCSLAAQGLWLRMLFLMHDSERYGYLVVNGSPMTSGSIARRCGCTPDEYEALLAELDSAGVPRRTKEGTIYNKRMVDDARERAQAAERKRKERERHVIGRTDVTPPVTDASRPSHASSSSSPSTSEKTEEKTKPRTRETPDLDLEALKSAVEELTGAKQAAGWEMADRISKQAITLKGLGFSGADVLRIAGNSARTKFELGFVAENIASLAKEQANGKSNAPRRVSGQAPAAVPFKAAKRL